MAALLAGARLVLRQGLRFLPAFRLQPAGFPVRRCLSMSPRLLETAVVGENQVDLEFFKANANTHLKSGSLALYEMGKRLKKNSRISKRQFLASIEDFCKAGQASSSQAWLLLQACGLQMPDTAPAERTELANKLWNKVKELGVKVDEYHYNMLLRKYIENEHKISPVEFLADMEAANVQPNLTTYELLIEAYCMDGDTEGASTILAQMKSINLPITEGIFCSLITGHARAGNMENAKHILSVMKESGLIPGKSAYIALLHAYAEKGDLENIKKTVEESSLSLRSSEYMKLIYSLVKSGHSQLVPEILEYIPSSVVISQDVINLCFMLLAEGYGDPALLVTKRFIIPRNQDDFFNLQSGNFFLRQCVNVNMPVNSIKKYASELQKSNLHKSPLQFALLCALQVKKKDMALQLLRTLKEGGLPVRTHYCYPLLAPFWKENNIRGGLQMLKEISEINIKLDLSIFKLYVAKWFDSAEAKSLLEELNFTEGFNRLYASTLTEELQEGHYISVCNSLSSNIPFDMDTGTLKTFIRHIIWAKDVTSAALITKNLCEDRFWLQNPLSETDSNGYFLCSLIDEMKASDFQVRKEHLKQYFHRLKEMGITIGGESASKIKRTFIRCKVPELVESVIDLMSKDSVMLSVEERFQRVANETQPDEDDLKFLLEEIIGAQDLEKALDLTEKRGSGFTFGMYMQVLRLCCVMNKPQEALQLKKEIDQKGFTEYPRREKYLGLFKVLAQNGLIEDAINVLKEMHERHVVVDSDSSRMLLRVLIKLAKNGNADVVKQLFNHIISLKLADPSKDLCSVLVLVHLQRNELALALEAMQECHLKYNFCPLEYITLVKIIEMGDTELLKKAVDFMNDIFGESNLLHSLLFAFIETGKYKEAQKIAETPGLRAIQKKMSWMLSRFSRLNMVEQMEKGVEITRHIFDCDRENMYYMLLRLYGSNNDWAKAIPLWYKMKEEAAEMKERTLQLFQNIFEENGEDITAHIPEFLEGKHLLKREVYADISKRVEDLCQNNMHQDAYEVFLEAEKNKQTLLRATYSKLFKKLMFVGWYDDAWKVNEIARSHYRSYTTDNLFLNHILASQVRRNCLKDALDMLQKMLENGNRPNAKIVEKIVETLSLEGDLDNLKKFAKLTGDLQEMNPRLESIMLHATLFIFFSNGNFEEAISAIESQLTKEPNTSMYNLSTLLVKNNMSEALEKLSIVTEMFANKLRVYRPVTDLFIAYANCGKIEEAKQLLERCSSILEQTGYLKGQIYILISNDMPDAVFQLMDILGDPLYKVAGYNRLMKHYISKRRLHDAVNLYHKMKAEEIETEDIHLKHLAVLLKDQDMIVPFPEPQESHIH